MIYDLLIISSNKSLIIRVKDMKIPVELELPHHNASRFAFLDLQISDSFIVPTHCKSKKTSLFRTWNSELGGFLLALKKDLNNHLNGLNFFKEDVLEHHIITDFCAGRGNVTFCTSTWSIIHIAAVC